MNPDAPTVELSHRASERLPVGHPLHDRWSLLFKGKAVLTFGTEFEARRAAKANGWVIVDGELTHHPPPPPSAGAAREE